MKFIVRNAVERDNLKQYIDRLPDKPYDVEMKPYKSRRSISQNSMYWAWLGLISDETGNTSNDLHDALRAKFLPFTERRVLGEIVQDLTSTTTLDTKEFTHYLELVDAFASSELGIVLPHPEDAFWSDFFEKYGKL